MSEKLRELLLKELRDAVAARMPDGTDPHEMTAELARRLRRIRRMQEDDARLRPGPADEDA